MTHAFPRLPRLGSPSALALLFGLLLSLGAGPDARAAGAHPRNDVMNASWYGKEQHHGPTASGQRFDMYGYTAAHRTLPLGTILRVHNPTTNETVKVTVTDRGPYIHGRDLDLSYAAARDLGILKCGVARLSVTTVGYDDRYAKFWKRGEPPASENN
jgi:rare lipoprotein A (peptidoglycan hydrolase)